jgi:hypothetical protein
MHLEILLEEPSMETVINSILNQIVVDKLKNTWQTHPYMGKQNLLKKLPALLRGYSSWLPITYPDYYIVIIVDQDQNDCLELKQRILNYANIAGIAQRTVIRIAVAELEAWFLGDIEALEIAFPKLKRLKLGSKATYRQPDQRAFPSEDLERELVTAGYNGYSKLSGSQKICQCLNLSEHHNKSKSFHVTLSRMKTLIGIDTSP